MPASKRSIVKFVLDPKNPPRLTKAEAARLDAMTDAEITAAAESDPDNPPLDDATLEALRFAGFVQKVRAASGLSQAQFARTYEIPVGTLRDWEQGRRRPDAPSLAYLKVIHRTPKAVQRALKKAG